MTHKQGSLHLKKYNGQYVGITYIDWKLELIKALLETDVFVFTLTLPSSCQNLMKSYLLQFLHCYS